MVPTRSVTHGRRVVGIPPTAKAMYLERRLSELAAILGGDTHDVPYTEPLGQLADASRVGDPSIVSRTLRVGGCCKSGFVSEYKEKEYWDGAWDLSTIGILVRGGMG